MPRKSWGYASKIPGSASPSCGERRRPSRNGWMPPARSWLMSTDNLALSPHANWEVVSVPHWLYCHPTVTLGKVGNLKFACCKPFANQRLQQESSLPHVATNLANWQTHF